MPVQNDMRPRRGQGVTHSILEFCIVVAMALVLAFIITHFIAQPYVIPSGSMEETISVNDRVLSEKISYYTGEPEAGDIVTFIDPEDSSRTLIKRVIDPEDSSRTLIKRVIATAGQTIELRDGQLLVDGVAPDEPYTLGKPSYGESFLDDNVVYTVPDGCIWCMGDNRTNSADCRDFGPVPLESVTGRAFFRYWPVSAIGTIH